MKCALLQHSQGTGHKNFVAVCVYFVSKSLQ